MNDDYRRYAKAAPLLGASAFAYALAFSCSAQVAAVAGSIVGLAVTRSLDGFKNRFQSDVDRILEPNKPTMETLIRLGFFCLAVTAALASLVAPALAAPLGLLIGAAVASNFLTK